MERTRSSFRVKRSMNGGLVAGIDLSEGESMVALVSPTRGVCERFSFHMDEDGYSLFASKVPKDARVAFEASGMAYPFHRALRRLGYGDITVAHPKELTWIVRSKKKNDRVDSLKIAKLHLVGMLPESHLLDRDEQIARDILIQRVKLGVEIGKLKTSVICYLKREGVYKSLPEASDNFSAGRRRAIRALCFGDGRDLVIKTLMERLQFLEAQCPPLEERIRGVAKESDDVRLLMSIPGVDFYLASLYSSYVGDVNRFPSADHLNSFFGIIPVSKDSANVKRRGKMSKDGPSIARWALSVMVDTVMRHNTHIRCYYLSVKRRTGSGSYAHVLTMKKLNRMIYHMLKVREHWRWEDERLTAEKIMNLERGVSD